MKRAEIVSVLELVGRALADNQLVPVFTCFCFTGETIYAYNDSLGIIVPFKSPDAFAVNGKTLLGLLSNSKAEEVTFQLSVEELTIKAGRSTFKLPYFKPEEFIFEDPNPKSASAISLPLDDQIFEALKLCLLTTSADYTHPALMGVCLNQQQKRTTFYSCDGDAVTRFTTSLAVPTAQRGLSFTLPNAFCETVLKARGEVEGKRGTLLINADWAKAKMDNCIIYGRLIENDKPLDHAALIKDTLKAEPVFTTVPKALETALARARVVADAENSKTELTVEAGKLNLLTTTHMGVVRDIMPLEKHPVAQANILAAMMQRSIGVCSEMAILENCTAYRDGEKLLVVVSNMG